MNTTEFKATKKKDIYKKFSVWSDRIIRETINRIICEQRNVPLKEAKDLQVLTGKEVELVTKELS